MNVTRKEYAALVARIERLEKELFSTNSKVESALIAVDNMDNKQLAVSQAKTQEMVVAHVNKMVMPRIKLLEDRRQMDMGEDFIDLHRTALDDIYGEDTKLLGDGKGTPGAARGARIWLPGE